MFLRRLSSQRSALHALVDQSYSLRSLQSSEQLQTALEKTMKNVTDLHRIVHNAEMKMKKKNLETSKMMNLKSTIEVKEELHSQDDVSLSYKCNEIMLLLMYLLQMRVDAITELTISNTFEKTQVL